MTRFQTITELYEGHLVYVLRDLETGAAARIVPGSGANCMELKLAAEGAAQPVAVINDMAFVGKLAEQSSRYGIPILFPWPSGVPKGVFAFGGRKVELNEPGVTASTHHGFVNTEAWRVVRSDCDNTGAWVTCAIRSEDCRAPRARRFPFSFVLEVTWKLSVRGFSMVIMATNTGAGAMPMGLGLHPYFTVPFGKGGSRGDMKLHVDAERQWNLKEVMDVEPGEAAPADPYLGAMTFDATAAEGRALGDVAFNHVYDAKMNGEVTRASVTDGAAGLRLTVTGGQDFGTWVIYSPPDRQAISLEPWTLVPNGFNLAESGMKGSGMVRLEPGKSWQGEVRVLLEKVG